jgi:hypothetical protein
LILFNSVKVSTQAIRTSVSSVFDQFAADQVQSEMDSFPQLEFVDDEKEWEEAEAEARADRTWCSLFLDGSLGEHKTTAPESAIVTVWDSLQEIAMYDESKLFASSFAPFHSMLTDTVLKYRRRGSRAPSVRQVDAERGANEEIQLVASPAREEPRG